MDRKTSFTIGKVTGVHGLNGNLKIWSYAESIETFAPGRTVLLKFENGIEEAHTILHAGPHQKGVLLNLEGIDSRNLAEDQIGKLILINRDQLDEPEEDTWFWEDLIGLDVEDETNGFIGKVETLFTTAAGDILVVKDKDRETLIPMEKKFVTDVDLDTGLIRVNMPEVE